MGEVLRLLGMTQDGALVPYLVGGVAVWAVMTVRGLRRDLDAMRAENREAHAAITDNIKETTANLTDSIRDVKADLGKRIDDLAARIAR